MKTRNVTVRSVFPLTIQKKRSRARQTIGLHRDFSIAVADLDGDEAPLALHRVVEPGSWSNPSITMRAWNGLPVARLDGRHPDEHHLRALQVGDPDGLRLLGDISDRERAPKVVFEAMPFDVDKVLYDGEDDHFRRIQKALDRFAFIDGVLHRIEPLPSYKITVGNKIELSLARASASSPNWQSAYRGINLNVDQFDHAVELATKIAEITPGAKVPTLDATSEWQVLDFSRIETARLPELLVNTRCAVNLALDSAKTSLTVLPPATFVKLGELAACKAEIAAPDRAKALSGVDRARDLISELHDQEFGVAKHHTATRAHLRRWSSVSLLAIDSCEPPAMVPEDAELDPDYERAVDDLAMLR
jgi:hypothetical protein